MSIGFFSLPNDWQQVIHPLPMHVCLNKLHKWCNTYRTEHGVEKGAGGRALVMLTKSSKFRKK